MPEEEKLEDILRSIRNIIDNGNKPTAKAQKESKNTGDSDDSILELTNEFKEDTSKIISNSAFTKSAETIEAFSKKLQDHGYSENKSSIDTIVVDLITPLLKDWLDNNLPKLVEKIISEELKKLVPKR